MPHVLCTAHTNIVFQELDETEEHYKYHIRLTFEKKIKGNRDNESI